MKASEKYTSSNAYVTGFGSSQRVVVWDNDPQELSSGLDSAGLRPRAWALRAAPHRARAGDGGGAVSSSCGLAHASPVSWSGAMGERWHIASLEDWAATAVLLLVLSILNLRRRAYRQQHQPRAGAPGRRFRKRGGAWHRHRPAEGECPVIPAPGRTIALSIPTHRHLWCSGPTPTRRSPLARPSQPAMIPGDRADTHATSASRMIPEGSRRLMPCLFCKIVAGEIPSKKIFEDELASTFWYINPQAPTHVLIVPRKHIASLAETGD